jgi:hypothetical protein
MLERHDWVDVLFKLCIALSGTILLATWRSRCDWSVYDRHSLHKRREAGRDL